MSFKSSFQRLSQVIVMSVHFLKHALVDFWVTKPALHLNPVQAKKPFLVGHRTLLPLEVAELVLEERGNLIPTISTSICCTLRGFKLAVFPASPCHQQAIYKNCPLATMLSSPITFGSLGRRNLRTTPQGSCFSNMGNMKCKNKFKHNISGGLFYDPRARLLTGSD